LGRYFFADGAAPGIGIVGKPLGKAVGSTVGSVVGKPLGSAVGKPLGSAVGIAKVGAVVGATPASLTATTATPPSAVFTVVVVGRTGTGGAPVSVGTGVGATVGATVTAVAGVAVVATAVG